MAEELTLKTNHKPSMFNKDMLLGALIGGMVQLGVPIPGVGSVIGAAIGAAIGGLIGKHYQEKENTDGKKVSSKTSGWNKDTLIGGLLGARLGGLAGAAAFIGITGKSMGTAALALRAGAAVPALGVGLGVALAAMAVGLVGGIVMGAKHGKEQQAVEYAQAQQQQQELQSGRSPELAPPNVEHAAEHTKQWTKDPNVERQQSTGHHR